MIKFANDRIGDCWMLGAIMVIFNVLPLRIELRNFDSRDENNNFDSFQNLWSEIIFETILRNNLHHSHLLLLIFEYFETERSSIRFDE